MTSEMDPAPADAWASAMAALRAINGPPPVDEAESGNLPEMTPRLGVKPVRGGIRDAPIVQHVGFGACPAGEPCGCPPVNVAAFHARWEGTKSRGFNPQPKTKSKADLRSKRPTDEGQRVGTVMGVPKQVFVDDGLTLPPLPDLAMDKPALPTSAKADAVDVHALCRTEQGKLHTRTIRAEYKLAKAQAEIERLKAQLAAQAAPKPARKARGKGK